MSARRRTKEAAPKSGPARSPSFHERCRELAASARQVEAPTTPRAIKEEMCALLKLVERLTGRFDALANEDETLTERAYQALNNVIIKYDQAQIEAAEIFGVSDWNELQFQVPDVVPAQIPLPHFVIEADRGCRAERRRRERKLSALAARTEVAS